MLIETSTSLHDDQALKHHNKTNSRQGKLERDFYPGEGGEAYNRMYFVVYR